MSTKELLDEFKEDVKRNFENLNHHVCSRAMTIDDMLDYIVPRVEKILTLQEQRHQEEMNYLKKIHEVELDAVSCQSLVEFGEWRSSRRDIINNKLQNNDTNRKIQS